MAEVQEQTQQIVNMSINDLIYLQVKELGKRMDRLEHRQDRLEEKLEITRREINDRMDKQDTKIEELRRELSGRIDKLEDKIDKLSDKIDSSGNHGQIATITTIGIALGVLYSLIFK